MTSPVHVLDPQGRVLATMPDIVTALRAVRARWGAGYGFLVRASDDVELARNSLYPRRKLPPAPGGLRPVAPSVLASEEVAA